MDSSVRVKQHTKELIQKNSKKHKITQDELIFRAINIAEKMNFEYDLPLAEIKKNQVIQTNRLIGFLKTQDKNLKQTEENIYFYFQNKLKEDRRQLAEFFYIKTMEYFQELTLEHYKENAEVQQNYMNRFKQFFSKAYDKLVAEVNVLEK
ncbi:hypothetical protein [Tenacibaculum finnmarkense]|uniref:hypothetical protein n=2 Tax=Tenacibaculum finnmarkense TaxID=2781243 RepID=UPI001EFA63ED|nr:hypothetical protein [Tenacibaculum finnmarkense]MCG8768610.1 hypothetical protein [Tenacibaculum finnmarkense]MCG8768615.1 hypothetical protein [Tenacibaculum finnmarkense]